MAIVEKKPTICVIGLGYIGLPTAGILAAAGYSVVGVDVDSKVVDLVNKGCIHIVEPGLEKLIQESVKSGRLSASVTPQLADVYLICVPTPFIESCSSIPQPNLDYVLAAASSLIPFLKGGELVILESTSPVGTTEKVYELFRSQEISIHMAYCPERVLPGNILHELIFNDRIVGGLTPESTTLASEFYKSFIKGAVIGTSSNTAEMCKLTENAFRDLNIAFANELSMICGELRVDVNELISLANHHPRVNILQPGPGVGGHCIAVDPWFIVARSPQRSRLIKAAREVNNQKVEWVITEVEKKISDLSAIEKRPLIACLGLAFKPNIDDLRESPAVSVVRALKENNIDLIVVEPNIESHPEFSLAQLDRALRDADLIVVLVAHREFVEAAIAGKFDRRAVVDYCGATNFF
ncbi:UDP-N-acetyl-D-mannosamine dehydrogenase [Polynucleobacter tropicus]|uniref:UDP-N-acetyl-D-mannosamine dehydrogenase n=1 Tax=Polynucleobacter tropicus TaxID=1743174 RepID=UPI001C2DB33D